MVPTDFRETLYTIDKRGRRKWVYAHILRGFYRRKREIVSTVLLLVYMLLPWILIRGKQALFFDIANGKLDVLGLTLWATDTFFLFLTLAILALSLFFFTALLGRVWCGWACPETIFLEFVFRPIERLIEGGPVQRKRLDESKWNLPKILKKGTKWIIYSGLAWALASTFLAYFLGRETLLDMMGHSPLAHPQSFILTACMMGIVLFQFGWFREQFCTVLCPYARFQSVLLDSNSLVVGYDKIRGEPRGKLGTTSGDCIDCKLCVRVCPTGIDIRNGIQLECIHCTACIDACDSIMASVNRPLGLIRYDTETGLAGKTRKFLRPRVILYGIGLFALLTLSTALLSTRSTTDFQFIREAHNLTYTELADKRITNHWKIHLANKSRESKKYWLKVLNVPEVELITPMVPIELGSDSDIMMPVFLNFPQSILNQGRRDLVIEVRSSSNVVGTQKVTILGPG